ncbi:hypothetical protein ABPG75_009215 [Micractinium tetrahymenae]
MGVWNWCCGGRSKDVSFAWRELTGYPFRNDHFTPEEWDRHLTFRRYFPEPRIVTTIAISMSPLWGWSVLCAAAVGLWAELAEPRGWPAVSTHPGFLAPFTLTSFALSLLMLFKTNSRRGGAPLLGWNCRQAVQVRAASGAQRRLCAMLLAGPPRKVAAHCLLPTATHASQPHTPFHKCALLACSYGRWWEARQAMGRLLVHSCNLVRLYCAYVAPAAPVLLPALRRWTAALTPSLAAYLRQRRHYFAFLEGEMHAEELAWLRQQPLPPVAALQVLSELLGRVSLPPMQEQQLQGLLNQVDAEVGCCERILRQPIPPGYSRHTQRFLLVFLTFLPVAFWPLFGWATLPIMAVLSFLLLAIEDIGVHLEEPFRVLPLNQMIAGTMRALHTMAASQHGAAALAAYAAEAGDPPAEERLARTVLRKSHADFSPRASHALSLSSWAALPGCLAWRRPRGRQQRRHGAHWALLHLRCHRQGLPLWLLRSPGRWQLALLTCPHCQKKAARANPTWWSLCSLVCLNFQQRWVSLATGSRDHSSSHSRAGSRTRACHRCACARSAVQPCRQP